MVAHRWWLLADLRQSTDQFFPEGLAEIVDVADLQVLLVRATSPRSSPAYPHRRRSYFFQRQIRWAETATLRAEAERPDGSIVRLSQYELPTAGQDVIDQMLTAHRLIDELWVTELRNNKISGEKADAERRVRTSDF